MSDRKLKSASEAPRRLDLGQPPYLDVRKRRLFRRLPPEQQEFLRWAASGVNVFASSEDTTP
jgi:hypothetical protein